MDAVDEGGVTCAARRSENQARAVDFEASQLLYRLALASAHRTVSRTQASVAAAGDPERAARAFDAATEAVILVQASAEAWINHLYESHGLVAVGGGWRARWNGIGHVAVADGLQRRSVPGAIAAVLDDVNAIRNFMLHGDAAARTRFEEQFSGQSIHGVLTAEYIETLLARTEELWKQARAITQHPTPFAQGAWIASDEFL